MKIIENKALKSQIKVFTHKSGLKVKMSRIPSFKSAYASISTKYGSADNSFKVVGENSFTAVPDGIAHFLEHKLFQNEDGVDAFELFSETGANANAYTSFDKTSYLFSCTDKFRQNLEILLGFVTAPYFTDQSVQKEQGIIGQEIQMYNDDPQWRVYLNALDCMYVNNPVKIDIAGSIESISKITPELLYNCYNAFYDLHNMVLSVAGNFDEQEVCDACDSILRKKPSLEVKKACTDEPLDVNCKYRKQKMDVSIPHFQIGFKLDSRGETQNELDSVYAEILLDVIAGESSPLYRKLYDEGLINDSFDSETLVGRDYFALFFGGESCAPEKVKELVCEEIDRLKKDGIDYELFSASQKALYGRYVRIFDKPSALADFMTSCEFAGTEIYDITSCAANATADDVKKILDRIDTQRSVLSVIVGR